MEKYSADYEFYNENPTGRSVGDCAVRAVSIALGVDWETAYALMAVAGYNLGDHGRASISPTSDQPAPV